MADTWQLRKLSNTSMTDAKNIKFHLPTVVSLVMLAITMAIACQIVRSDVGHNTAQLADHETRLRNIEMIISRMDVTMERMASDVNEIKEIIKSNTYQ